MTSEAQDQTNEEEVQLDPSLIVEEVTPEEEPQPEAKGEDSTETEPEQDIPDKYKGKTAMDIIRMHQEAERIVGRQGNEVGQLRQMVDDLILNTKTSDPAPQDTETDPTEFFSDPQEATRKAVEKTLANDPTLNALRQDAEQSKRERSAQALLHRHPDAGEISQDPKFGEWIGKSKVRTQMFQTAHTTFDNEIASELFDQYKAVRKVADTTAANAQAQRQESVKNASTGSGKSSSTVRGKPILSRERLIELKINNPDAYYAQQPMIKEAYREGRVK